MIFGNFEFKPRIWATLLSCAGILLMLSLGNWQLSRAHEKQLRQDQWDMLGSQARISMPSSPIKSEDFQYRQVEVEGSFDSAKAIYLDNRLYRGVVGYHVVMPLRIGTSNMHVLVDRGWVAAGNRRDQLPDVMTLPDTLKIEGIAVVPTQNFVELSSETVQGKLWENLVLERYRKVFNVQVQPIVIQQTSDSADGLVREWGRPDAGVNKHKAYAFQWFALAVGIAVIFVVMNVKRIQPFPKQD